MLRSLHPELLDSLPPDHPDALHNRRDLRVINRLMGSDRWFRKSLLPRHRPGEKMLEIGAGAGELGCELSRFLPPIDGLDLWPRPPAWPANARWHSTDLVRFSGWEAYDIVLGSLIFHQFDNAQLGTLGERLRASRCRLLLASEPARLRRFQWLYRASAPLLGANRVTRHDAHVSIAAGFVGDELPAFARPEPHGVAMENLDHGFRRVPDDGGENSMNLRPIEIAGGGLAGLSLGVALRKAGVPVTIFEAGDYPRHRVCGEFIAGLKTHTLERLGVQTVLADARGLSGVSWFHREKPIRRDTLPAPAWALSRHSLDQRLAELFVEVGGQLHTRTRVDPTTLPAGRVATTGRQRTASPWLGLKLHLRGISLANELELHLGRACYVGLSAVENQRTNVCGLFRKRSLRATTGEPLLIAYLRACGLEELVQRIGSAEICHESASAVAGLPLVTSGRGKRMAIGDAFAMPPPFTGNGMAMAFQGAEAALDVLLAWSRRELEWPEAIRLVNVRLRKLFRLRLTSGAILHPFLLRPSWQRGLAAFAGRGLLPVRPLYHALH